MGLAALRPTKQQKRGRCGVDKAVCRPSRRPAGRARQPMRSTTTESARTTQCPYVVKVTRTIRFAQTSIGSGQATKITSTSCRQNQQRCVESHGLEARRHCILMPCSSQLRRRSIDQQLVPPPNLPDMSSRSPAFPSCESTISLIYDRSVLLVPCYTGERSTVGGSSIGAALTIVLAARRRLVSGRIACCS